MLIFSTLNPILLSTILLELREAVRERPLMADSVEKPALRNFGGITYKIDFSERGCTFTDWHLT